MLDQYLQRTQLLLSDPAFEVFNEGDLTSYINSARGQIAGATESIRVYGAMTVAAASQQYSFASITLTGFTTSCLGVLNVRQISFAVGSGQRVIPSRPFPWFNQYTLGQATPEAGEPSVWSQFGQGASGTLFFNLLDTSYTLALDVVAYPVPLVDDSTTEALPYQFTDAVPFMAAYYAALSMGDMDKADLMWKEQEKFTGRARVAVTSSVLPTNFPQTGDPFMPNRLGLQSKGPQ